MARTAPGRLPMMFGAGRWRTKTWTGGSVIHLSMEEQKTVVDALIEQRERQESAMTQTEQILRRMTGSITAYMDVVGQRPLHMSEFDKAVLAIRDGDLEAFKQPLPGLFNYADKLLLETAGRPGAVGRKMTLLTLDMRGTFQQGIYRAACLLAIGIADSEKTLFLLEQAQSHVPDLPVKFYGDIAECAYMDYPYIAGQIIDRCTPEQMDAVPADLLYKAMLQNDYHFAYKLADKGISADGSMREIAGYCARNAQNWDIAILLQIGTDNYCAIYFC